MPLQEELESQGNFLFKYRGILPLLILVVGIAVLVVEVQADPYAWEYQEFTPLKWASFAVCIFGLLIRMYTVGHTPKHTSGRNTKEQVADVLNSTGIYSTVRHPLYVGNFFMWLGVGMLTGNVWFLVAFTFIYWVYYERIMFAEEQFLRRKFGKSYTEWAGDTPAFWPSFKHFKKPAVPFSWPKVIKKEKNGILAIFICFWVFDIVSQSVIEGELAYQLDFWFYASMVTFVGYFIIKLLRKNTSVLEEK